MKNLSGWLPVIACTFMVTIKKVILGVLVAVLLLPAFQKATRVIWLAPLDGYSEPETSLELSWNSFRNGTYQDKFMRHLDHSTGFRNALVRVNNQVDYSLFSLPHARKVVVGKNGYLFEEPYIKSWYGLDFIGKRNVEARTGQLKQLQDQLWKERGILLVIALSPDKGTFFHEYFPERYQKYPVRISNYQWYKKKLAEKNVSFIDFNDWFLKMKDTSTYRLFPKTGIHWSSYGACIAFDSLVRYIRARKACNLPRFEAGSILVSNEIRGRDGDLGKGMNLLWDIPQPPMAYPHVHYDQPSGAKKPSALFIGDSFYFTWSEAGYIANVFRNRDFWYYDYYVYSGSYDTGRRAANEDLVATILRQDVIVIMQTNGGYGNLGYGFIDRLQRAMIR
ncbi:MAG: hypothetical protein NT040_05575 [Bacteroidetes bacterium]|nr:hypothetical protein [Bacteroidota bacterium]